MVQGRPRQEIDNTVIPGIDPEAKVATITEGERSFSRCLFWPRHVQPCYFPACHLRGGHPGFVIVHCRRVQSYGKENPKKNRGPHGV